MFEPIKIMDVELSHPIKDIDGLNGYVALKALVRLHGRPIGYVTIPVPGGRCSRKVLAKNILEQHNWSIVRHLINRGLAEALEPDGLRIDKLVHMTPLVYQGRKPLVTVAVCTRDRTSDLKLCLDVLIRLVYPHLDLLVVDNAPSNKSTEELINQCYPNVRYVCEPRPGLDWARNRAIAEAQGEIIAFTDDDVVVDPEWVNAFVEVFAENPEVMAVTGLVVPYELETDAQILFEKYGGFGRGFERKWYRLNRVTGKREIYQIGAGAFGTGANMAFRRTVFDKIGGFDPALDVGTVTNGGGDLEMFYRVLEEGYTLVYEPNAIVRHRHGRSYTHLKTQLTNHGVGFYSYLMRSALAYPSERVAILKFGIWWLLWWNLRRWLLGFIHPMRFPRELIWAELKGSLVGLVRYQKARRHAERIANTFSRDKQSRADGKIGLANSRQRATFLTRAKQTVVTKELLPWRFIKPLNPVAVCEVELSKPLQALNDVLQCNSVHVFVALHNRLLGSFSITNLCQPISAARLRAAIADNLGLKLFEGGLDISPNAVWAKTLSALNRHFFDGQVETLKLPVDVKVSIILATRDRPNDLRECLRCLLSQKTLRQVEMVVVDNNPDSGLTPPVVAEFPGVILVRERRKGLSYARNKGFVASSGDIVITIDDDVIIPPHWLENLLKPFARGDVMAVTGNILPFQLETKAQFLFEAYGGLGRGFMKFEANGDWFEQFRYASVPTWTLGATANAAFRTTIFNHPQIGMLDESLGVGTPTGCSEDTYLFYKILKVGYTLVYEPEAYVWHKHRREMKTLRKQIYNYSKGHVAYHLKTLIHDHDLRALARLTVGLPLAHVWRVFQRLRGKSVYPVWLILLEILGNLVAPFALLRSYLRVKRLGRSDHYMPASQRSIFAAEERPSRDNQWAKRLPAEMHL